MTSPETRQPPALLALAREQGEQDVFAGKRQWARYSLGVRTEVTTDPTNPAAAWSVITHNISGGGIGFWSKRSLSQGTAIHIKDLSDDKTQVWIPAKVTHCVVGIRGYLLGSSFYEPLPPEDELPSRTSESPEDGRKSTPTIATRLVARSMSARCAAAAAIASGASVLLVPAMAIWIPSGFLVIGPTGIAVVIALGIGGACGWLASTRVTRALKELHATIRDVAAGKTNLSQFTDTPTRELSAIRRSLLDLGMRLRIREQDERVHREKIEEITQIKSNILAIVSHDMRTPLTSILLYAEMLSEELDTLSDEDQRNFLGIISGECTRLSRLVDDLLEVQRLESGRMSWNLKAHDLSDTIRACAGVFDAMATSKQIELVVDCPAKLPQMEADADKISQVLSNLLSNAIKYTQNGGRVEVSAEVRRNDLVLRVADNGPGIPRDQWDQIFDRFTQIRDPNVSDIAGVGLGLYIVKRLVEGHHGSVWVDSEPGHGCEFIVSLPMKVSDESASNEHDPANASRRIVVCDPDPELAAAIVQILHTEGFDVRSAHSGKRLIQILGNGDIDLVITDVLLPDVSGAELLASLTNVSGRRYRVIIHSYDGDGQDLTRRGVDVFLRRPVAQDDLLQAVRVALQKGSATGQTVLLVESQTIDANRFYKLFEESGHTVLLADGLDEAARLARDYSIDVLVISSHLLSRDWQELERLELTTRDRMRVKVLCDNVRKHERQLEELLGVQAVVHRPGQEEAIVDEVTASQAVQLAEIAS